MSRVTASFDNIFHIKLYQCRLLAYSTDLVETPCDVTTFSADDVRKFIENLFLAATEIIKNTHVPGFYFIFFH